MSARDILNVLKEDPRQTPTMIAEKIDRDPQYIRNILSVLQSLKIVKTPAKGVYEITTIGNELMEKIKRKQRK